MTGGKKRREAGWGLLCGGWGDTVVAMDTTHSAVGTPRQVRSILKDWFRFADGGHRIEWSAFGLAALLFILAAVEGKPRSVRIDLVLGVICLFLGGQTLWQRARMIRSIVGSLEKSGAFSTPTTTRLTDGKLEIRRGDTLYQSLHWKDLAAEYVFVPHGLLLLREPHLVAWVGDDIVAAAGKERLDAVLEAAGLRRARASIGTTFRRGGLVAGLLTIGAIATVVLILIRI